jgi:hypothetical protein
MSTTPSGSERGEAVAFPTKVDLWLAIVVGVALVVSLGAATLGFVRAPGSGWFALALILGITTLIGAISLPTEYVVLQTELVVRSGVLRTRIPLERIERVYPTSNPLSAPAWSLDRVGIDYRVAGGRRLALVSPAQQTEFMKLLAERADLTAVRGELRRSAGGVER